MLILRSVCVFLPSRVQSRRIRTAQALTATQIDLIICKYADRKPWGNSAAVRSSPRSFPRTWRSRRITRRRRQAPTRSRPACIPRSPTNATVPRLCLNLQGNGQKCEYSLDFAPAFEALRTWRFALLYRGRERLLSRLFPTKIKNTRVFVHRRPCDNTAATPSGKQNRHAGERQVAQGTDRRCEYYSIHWPDETGPRCLRQTSHILVRRPRHVLVRL